MNLPDAVIADIQAHAIRDYPNEAVGAVKDGPEGLFYIPMANIAADPKHDFELSLADDIDAKSALAIVHSHPDGPDFPSGMDITQQVASAIPWGLVVTNGRICSKPWFWGGSYRPPLLGREFRHGPSGTDNRGDCYALIKDWYHEQRGICLPEFARDDRWWESGARLYEGLFERAGGVRVMNGLHGVQIGDVLLMDIIRSGTPTHGAIWLGDGLILHHLPRRLSRRDPLGEFHKLVTHVLRYPSHA